MELSPVSSTTTLFSSEPHSLENVSHNASPESVLEKALDLLMTNLARHKYSEGKVNVVEALQEFWEQRSTSAAPSSVSSGLVRGPPKAAVCYETDPSESGPFRCFVTLPSGACFASHQACASKAEARRSAARVALLNSVLDDCGARRISEQLVEGALRDLEKPDAMAITQEAMAILRDDLLSHCGEGLLGWESRLCALRLLHWNGTLRAMRERGVTRDEVLECYSARPVDDSTRSLIALDWMVREQAAPGALGVELRRAEAELRRRQAAGRELRFEKERRDILRLAQRQVVAEAAAKEEENGGGSGETTTATGLDDSESRA